MTTADYMSLTAGIGLDLVGLRYAKAIGAYNGAVAGRVMGVYAGLTSPLGKATGVLLKGAAPGFVRGLYARAETISFFRGVTNWLQACFAAGTKILAKGAWGEGWREIEKITLDDELASRDENNLNGPVEWKKVEELFRRTGCIFHLHVNGQVVRTTGEHPFFEYTKGWTAAANLEKGDRLAGLDGQQWVTVEEVFDTGLVETVYNLGVVELHTYFVGSEGWDFSVWAHNQECFGNFEAKLLRRGAIDSANPLQAVLSESGELGRIHKQYNKLLDMGFGEEGSLAWAQKQIAERLEAIDHGHSLSRHGPELTPQQLQDRLATGFTAETPPKFSPAPRSTQFIDYDTWLAARQKAVQAFESDPAFRQIPGPGDQLQLQRYFRLRRADCRHRF